MFPSSSATVLFTAVLALLMLSPPSHALDPSKPSYPQYGEMRRDMAMKVRGMINHAFDNYIENAFPKDELKPISCTGHDTLGSYALTLIDALDVLAMSGRHDDFRKYTKWVAEHINFDRDANVSVFETSIRILGGLISAHFMYEEGVVAIDPLVYDYDGDLLELAIDLADRLLPAFDTPTDIPYGTVNLRYGVPKGEIDETATASAGTFILEFTVITAVTGDPKYELAARRALRGLFSRRTDIGLVGNHINITSGKWTLEYGSVGTGVDSFIEYLIKAHLMTGDLEFLKMYRVIHDAFTKYTRKGPWYLDTHIYNGGLVFQLHNSLASFYPGTLVLGGNLAEAKEAVDAVHALYRRVGALPEGHHLVQDGPHPNQKRYPLRPEHAESIFLLYRATGDPTYLEMGKEFATALHTRTYVPCGFAALEDTQLHDWKSSDNMESFVLSETLKYLLLLFDEGTPSAGLGDSRKWVFNTEGHPIPITDEWRLDDFYDPRRQRGTAGVPESGHPLSGLPPSDYRCPVEDIGGLDSTLPRTLVAWPHISRGGEPPV